ncbi:MAG: peptidase domain-containing ABC transporter [Cytophagaceae bacterium]
MILSQIYKIHEVLLNILKLDTNIKELSTDGFAHFKKAPESFDQFMNMLQETGNLVHMAFIQKQVTEVEFEQLFDRIHVPYLIFFKSGTSILPVVINPVNNTSYAHIIDSDGNDGVTEINSFKEIRDKICPAGQLLANPEEDTFTVIVNCIPNQSIYSDNQPEDEKDAGKKLKAFTRFFKLVASERKEISFLYIYAIIAGIMTLSLPLGVQAIINYVTSGAISTSIVVLICVITLVILISGGLQVMQLTLVEYIQQRLFAKTAFEFSYRIPKIKVESVMKYYPPELMNRFFDIVTLQKGIASILLEFSSAILQVVFGLILLSLYHPSFIVFGASLMLILGVVIRFTGPKGLKSSLNESKYKYEVANWLEEIARALSTFKLAGYSNLPMEKTDYYVSNYVHYRKQHFKVLLTQYLSFVSFKALITAGLLTLGCVLLIRKEINIGQFVASEIVIILIINAVEKVILKLDTFYDVLTSLEKIGTVTDLPIEIQNGISIDSLDSSSKGLSLQIKDLKYKFPAEPGYILKGINLDVESGDRVCISGYSSSGKTTFLNIMLGFLTSYEGNVSYNKISLREINKYSLVNMIGDNISQEDLFDGTILENITLGRNIKLEDVLWAVDCLNLNDFVATQKSGLNTKITGGTQGISESIAKRLIVARSIVTRPKMLVLEDNNFGLERAEKIKLTKMITSKENPWTVIMVSNDPDIMSMCNTTIVMKDGAIVCKGRYDEIKNEDVFQTLI